jgi:segregation and condensation protein B
VIPIPRILEAVLFSADGPLTIEQIAFAVPDVPADEITESLAALRRSYAEEARGWRLEEVASGWQLFSDPELYSYVERFLEGKRRARLSRAALEALAVVAYRQPITRGQLEEMRGVDCGGVIHTLMERDLVTVCGRSEAIGRPLLYGTTHRFLEHFGLSSLTALPRLEEIDHLRASDEIRTQIEEEAQRRFGIISEDSGNGQAAPDGPGGNGQGNHDVASDGNGQGEYEPAPDGVLPSAG